MTAFPKYEHYKDSGVEWLGEIPDHWEVSKSRWIWKEVEDPSERGDEQLLSISQYTGVTPTTSDSRSESLVGYRRCMPDDLAMNIMLAWQGGLGVSNYEGIVSPAYSVFRLRSDNNAHFLGYLYRTKRYLDEFGRNSTGIVPSRWRLYPDKFGHILTLLPPKPEQDRIVDFLDRKTAEIDTLIAKKQRQIELLDEQKAILINRAVTRGLNPNAKLKPSGIEWIGEIPEHWEVKSLKRISNNVSTGRTPSNVAHADELPHGVHWYTPGDYQNTGFLDSSERRAKSTKSETVETFPAGSIFYIGIGATLGRVNLSLHEAGCNQQINVIQIDTSKHCSEYMLRLLDSGREFIFSSSDFTTLPILNRSKTAALPVVTSPKDEQESIAVYCAEVIFGVQSVQAKVAEQIQSLQTLRSTLIAHAVTGRIKV